MDGHTRIDGGPRTAVVVGAGIVGLSTAWFLQERGIEVTVVDRDGVAAGASWGNAGWLSPGLAIPLNEPSVLRYGLRALLDPKAPLHVPTTVDVGLWRFLLQFAANCRWGAWERAARANLPFNAECLEAFDILTSGGVTVPTISAPITALFESPRQATGLLKELKRITAAGGEITYRGLTGDELAEAAPQASSRINAGVRLEGQRFIDPGAFVCALADSVRERGGVVRSGFDVDAVRPRGHAVTLETRSGELISGDVVVLATGAWLNRLARSGGVRVPVRAGRGYSFTVPTDEPVPGPVYLPDVRVACTPYRGALRVAGTMEFRSPDAPLDRDRIRAIIDSARDLLRGVRWNERTDEWVGPRPVTPDGMPLIGATTAPGVYVAGGHGMWGLTQGPITGRLLAEQIATGKQPEALRPVDPLR
ncbi:NAD(P)/FAD-dependent oxidoreductase [Saccharomonospora viridis]|uniref:Glycine/D-amino acid oxidase, deaminating n=2 Tax=Saccharomonospora viridis TaxID=1852 RepID=C7MXQ8_SACVD|nr:FAD-dependent oxidoreductase [Saccharomonospora viridis]ACU97337.1 glycine/D-amino acid oxidase, deaminating [Saccharomonospora viridis DSM 43017]KHF43610.1 D-amino acid dehydrogenase [Saccharomonospora viridis]SFO76298.1 D-amino-acid dehydrogenase [Saccharomonospora viridis]